MRSSLAVANGGSPVRHSYSTHATNDIVANDRIPPSLTPRYCLYNHLPRRTPAIAMDQSKHVTTVNRSCTTNSVCHGLVAPVDFTTL